MRTVLFLAAALIAAITATAASHMRPDHEAKDDTTLVYNRKTIHLTDSDGYMKVRVYDRQGEEYKTYYEARFSDMTEEETFYITSPLYPASYRKLTGRYQSIVPAVFCGMGTMGRQPLDFGNNAALHLSGLRGNYEAGLSLLSLEYTQGRRGWGLSYSLQAFVAGSTFKTGYNLGNTEDRNTEVKQADTSGRRGYLTYLGARMRLMAHYMVPLRSDRLHFGLGCSFELHEGDHTYWQDRHEDYRQAESAYLNMHPFGFGIDAQVGFDGLFVYAHKSLTPLFSTRHAPRAFPFTVGLGLTF